MGWGWICVKKMVPFLAAYLLLFSALFGVLSAWPRNTSVVSPVLLDRVGNLILDAGHGGEDGGAVAPSGVPESQINLEIVQKMSDLLRLYGQSPILTRQEDVSLHDSDADSLRKKKVSDLKNRVELIESVPDATLVSIHQNTYPDPACRGTQVFYASTADSQPLAELLQTTIRTALQPENSRTAKPISKGVYLMNHISCPAALVECGFLTNGEEAALLQSDEYQRKLSLILAAALLTQNIDSQ